MSPRAALVFSCALLAGCSHEPDPEQDPAQNHGAALHGRLTSAPALLLATPSEGTFGALHGTLRVEVDAAVPAGATLRVWQGYRDDGHELRGAELRYGLAPVPQVGGRALLVGARLVDRASHKVLGPVPMPPWDGASAWLEVRLDRPWPATAVLEIGLGDPERSAAGLPTNPLPVDLDLFAELSVGGRIIPLDGRVPVRLTAARSDWLRVLVPAEAQPETPVPVTVSFMAGFSGPESSSHEMPLPEGSLELVTADGAVHASFPVTAAADESLPNAFHADLLLPPGVWRIAASFGDTPALRGISNPVVVRAGPRRLFFGSIHDHTTLGGHATSTPPRALRYARDLARLDFVALSEHREAPTFDGAWLADLARRETADDRFVVFTAWEWTDARVGHRHVLQRTPIVPASSPPDWTTFAATVGHDPDALVVVHHPLWDGGTAQRDYDYGEPGACPRQLLAETYSWHGDSLRHDSKFPLHGNHDQEFPPERGTAILAALARGHRLYLVADSDNHLGRPGGLVGIEWPKGRRYAWQGVTAVRAEGLNRDDLFRAMEQGDLYGTTGARLHLEAVRRDAGHVSVAIHATAPLSSVLIRSTEAVVASQAFEELPPDAGPVNAPLYLDPRRGTWDAELDLDCGAGHDGEPLIVEVGQQDFQHAWLLLAPASWHAR